MCAQIAAAQGTEIQQLRDWLLRWYGIAYEGRVTQGGTMNRLERLEDERFDIEISAEFIEHHSVQIENSVRCLQRAFHTDLLQMCREQIDMQSEEILEVRSILTDHGVVALL